MRNPNLEGWHENPAAVEASTIALGGNDVLWGSDSNPLKGYHRRQVESGVYGSFLWKAEEQLFGKSLQPFHQRRGTCVGQGGARMAQDTWYNFLTLKGEIGRRVWVSVAASYAVGRIQIGRGQIQGDGLVGSWIIEGMKKFGLAERKQYGSYDLSQYNGDEQYAVSWGESGSSGCPQIILQEMSKIKVRAYRCMTAEDMADAIWAKYAVMFCGRTTINDKDSRGYTRLNKPAHHCIEVAGGLISRSGELYLGGQQSWGPDRPSGVDKAEYKGGSTNMRDGMAFAPAQDWDYQLKRTGEAWAISFEEGYGFR